MNYSADESWRDLAIFHLANYPPQRVPEEALSIGTCLASAVLHYHHTGGLGPQKRRVMTFETIISLGLAGWMAIGFIMMGLGIW